MTNFSSVSTSSARYQDLSLNPQKLAGQCAKLKCCLNYEMDTYVEAQKDFPSKDIPLETKDGSYYLVKTDILKRILTYSTNKDFLANEVSIPVERAKQVIQLNRKGIQVENLSEAIEQEKQSDFGDILTEDGLTRFDTERKPGRNRKPKDKERRKRPTNTPETDTANKPRFEKPKKRRPDQP